MQIKIAVIVGDNGAYAVGKYEGPGTTDWAFLEDIIGICAKGETTYPEHEQRYVITADVDLPVEKTVAALSVEAVTE